MGTKQTCHKVTHIPATITGRLNSISPKSTEPVVDPPPLPWILSKILSKLCSVQPLQTAALCCAVRGPKLYSVTECNKDYSHTQYVTVHSGYYYL